MFEKFLEEQGFIEKTVKTDKKTSNPPPPVYNTPPPNIPPTYFPPTSSASAPNTVYNTAAPTTVLTEPESEPNFPDPAFVKFFESELIKANQPGPDYFEFRQQRNLMMDNYKAKGKNVDNEVIMDAIVTNFQSQNVKPENLIQSAQYYLDVLSKKRDGFIADAENEKNKQLKNRENNINTRTAKIESLNTTLTNLQKQLEDTAQQITKEKTDLEVAKTMGQDAINKLGNAERLINLTCEYLKNQMTEDINKLQNS